MPLVAVEILTGQMFSIYVLEENNRCELLEFINSLEQAHSCEWPRLQRYLDYTKDHGLLRNLEQFKHLADGICYFRTRGVRLFCFRDASNIICTNGYIKKKDRLDPAEVKRSKIWKQKYDIAKIEKTLKVKRIDEHDTTNI